MLSKSREEKKFNKRGEVEAEKKLVIDATFRSRKEKKNNSHVHIWGS